MRITDLVINTATETYGVGVALDFSANPPHLLGIAARFHRLQGDPEQERAGGSRSPVIP